MSAMSNQPFTRGVRRPACNTATWVGEDYARRIAREMLRELMAAYAALKQEELTLAGVRKSRVFLRDEPARVGPGFKMGYRTWLCMAFEESQFAIFSADFNDRGAFRRADMPIMFVGRHFLERAFERFARSGTNYIPDITRDILAPMSSLARPKDSGTPGIGLSAEVDIPNIGRIILETMLCPAPSDYLAWVAKTFLPPQLDEHGARQFGMDQH